MQILQLITCLFTESYKTKKLPAPSMLLHIVQFMDLVSWFCCIFCFCFVTVMVLQLRFDGTSVFVLCCFLLGKSFVFYLIFF